jgi:Alpha-2-macroglobulin family
VLNRPPRTRRNFFEVIDVADVEVFKSLKYFANKNLTFLRKTGNKAYDEINGVASIYVSVPDSITTYNFSAVSMNDCYGLGLSCKATSLKVFKEFFIQLTLPFQCKRTEVVTLNILVFSYLPKKQSVTLSVARNDLEFSVINPADSGWRSMNLKTY